MTPNPPSVGLGIRQPNPAWEQTSFVPKLDPADLMMEAMKHRPLKPVACLLSGGKDSTVLAHRMRPWYDVLVFIDTGTAAPGVREFVEAYAEELGKPLKVYEAGDAYREMVLSPNLGFPGRGGHNVAYNRLKERQLEVLRREIKQGKRGGKVLYVTGVRRAESLRRSKRKPLTVVGSMAFVNPLIDWTDAQMQRYHSEHAIPVSDAVALTHRSSECNCGAYSRSNPGEREELERWWPEWFENTIASLEREAQEAGVKNCRWGGPDTRATDTAGMLCSDCQLSFARVDELHARGMIASVEE